MKKRFKDNAEYLASDPADNDSPDTNEDRMNEPPENHADRSQESMADELSEDVVEFREANTSGALVRPPVKKKKKWTTRKTLILLCVVGFVLVILMSIGIYVYSIWSNPMAQFKSVADQFTAAPSAEESEVALPGASASASASEDPYQKLLSQADMSALKDIVNIMLIGVDYAPEREDWDGKHAYHSDVMIVCAINTKTGEVNLISLPRDTYAQIPGVKGIYKLNASIDCGGGWPTATGFEKVCQAASWMIGDIPIQYYYAVDMSAVKGLVDAIGGVDYNLEMDFKMMGRSYTKGQQHMGGQAVLDYLRVRKDKDIINAEVDEEGDLNRINRQKMMLVAIFEKLKSTNLLLTLPDILKSFDGNLKTNIPLSMTAGFAAYAYQIGSDKIYMNSMEGTYKNIFNWRFVITNQTKRIALIKKVYGIDVPSRSQYDMASANSLWENMQASVIVDKSEGVLSKVKKLLDADDKLPVYVEPTPSPSPSPSPSASPKKSPAKTTASSIPKGYRQYGDTEHNLYSKANQECDKLAGHKSMSTDSLSALNTQLKADIEKLCSIFKISKPGWDVHYETSSNEVKVDFR